MLGFNLSIGIYKFPKHQSKWNTISGNISSIGFSIDRFTLNKFEVDKLFFEKDNYISVLEGVILNNHLLMQINESGVDAVIRLYNQNGDAFFISFKGSFSGVFYDERDNKWIVFTDQIGSKHIYYANRKNNIGISSEIEQLYGLLKN